MAGPPPVCRRSECRPPQDRLGLNSGQKANRSHFPRIVGGRTLALKDQGRAGEAIEQYRKMHEILEAQGH